MVLQLRVFSAPPNDPSPISNTHIGEGGALNLITYSFRGCDVLSWFQSIAAYTHTDTQMPMNKSKNVLFFKFKFVVLSHSGHCNKRPSTVRFINNGDLLFTVLENVLNTKLLTLCLVRTPHLSSSAFLLAASPCGNKGRANNLPQSDVLLLGIHPIAEWLIIYTFIVCISQKAHLLIQPHWGLG